MRSPTFRKSGPIRNRASWLDEGPSTTHRCVCPPSVVCSRTNRTWGLTRSKRTTVPFTHRILVVSNRTSEWCALSPPLPASTASATMHAVITCFMDPPTDTVPQLCYRFMTRLFVEKDRVRVHGRDESLFTYRGLVRGATLHGLCHQPKVGECRRQLVAEEVEAAVVGEQTFHGRKPGKPCECFEPGKTVEVQMFERRIARADRHFGDLRLVAHLKPTQVWKALEVAKVLQVANLAERKVPEFRQRLDRTDRLAIPEDEFQRLQGCQSIDELERELRRGLNRQDR